MTWRAQLGFGFEDYLGRSSSSKACQSATFHHRCIVHMRYVCVCVLYRHCWVVTVVVVVAGDLRLMGVINLVDLPTGMRYLPSMTMQSGPIVHHSGVCATLCFSVELADNLINRWEIHLGLKLVCLPYEIHMRHTMNTLHWSIEHFLRIFVIGQMSKCAKVPCVCS